MTRDPEHRFQFGKNWSDFFREHYTDERLAIAQEHLLRFLGRSSLEGLSFLDIGSGSGIHSFAAHRAGAEKILSIDFDRNSVSTTQEVRRLAGSPPSWEVRQGSVLDESMMRSLPKFDVVYSWGVLHHTGAVWEAIRNAAAPLKAGGVFYIALYSADVHQDPTPQFWLDVKQEYLRRGEWGKRRMELWYIWKFQMGRIWAWPRFLWRVLRYRRIRGMSYMTDVRDWLGGWPMEFVYDADVTKFAERELGLKLVRIATGEANTEFLFIAESPAQA